MNARSGAGNAYPIKDRFAPNCTIGFDGFCYGQGLANSLETNLPDQRWLVVHHRSEVVAAAFINLDNAPQELGTLPAENCSKFHGAVTPQLLSWRALNAGHGSVDLTAQATREAIVSFGIELSATITHGAFPYQTIAYFSTVPSSRGYGSSPLWKLASSFDLAFGNISIYAVAEACSANDSLVINTSHFKRLIFKSGQLVGAVDIGRGQVPSADQLEEEACSLG